MREMLHASLKLTCGKHVGCSVSPQTTSRLQPIHHGMIPSVQSRVFHRETLWVHEVFLCGSFSLFSGDGDGEGEGKEVGEGRSLCHAAHILLARDKSHGHSASSLRRTLGGPEVSPGTEEVKEPDWSSVSFLS